MRRRWTTCHRLPRKGKSMAQVRLENWTKALVRLESLTYVLESLT